MKILIVIARAQTYLLIALIITTVIVALYHDGKRREAFQNRADLESYRPETSALATKSNTTAALDASNASSGYIAVRYTGDSDFVKVSVEKDDEKNIYDIPWDKNGEYVILPLHAGSGEYTISVLENLEDITFMEVLKETEVVSIYDETLPFLYPSLKIDFDKDSYVTRQAGLLAESVESDAEFMRLIYYWLTATIEYDNELEERILAGEDYVTVIDEVILSGKGICIDFSTIMVAMLRSQGIPAKVVVGSVERGSSVLFPHHTWVSVCLWDKSGYKWVDVDPSYGVTHGRLMGMKDGSVSYIPKYSY